MGEAAHEMGVSGVMMPVPSGGDFLAQTTKDGKRWAVLGGLARQNMGRIARQAQAAPFEQQ